MARISVMIWLEHVPLCNVVQWLPATVWEAESCPANAFFSFSDLTFNIISLVLGSLMGSVNSTLKEDFNSLVSDKLEWQFEV